MKTNRPVLKRGEKTFPQVCDLPQKKIEEWIARDEAEQKTFTAAEKWKR